MSAIRRVVISALVIVAWMGATATPSHGVVHEIVGQWCSGQGELEPPGIADPTGRNFAQPLEAMGFVGEPVFRADLGGLLIPFDFDEPASKVVGTGTFIQIGSLPDGTPLFIEQIALDPEHPAFQHCPRLFTP
jgi:hypothetical protein